jgi:hypothetical protein
VAGDPRIAGRAAVATLSTNGCGRVSSPFQSKSLFARLKLRFERLEFLNNFLELSS